MKHCNICNTTKEDSAFGVRAASVDGLAARCRLCQREYDQNRKDCQKRKEGRALYAKTPRGRETGDRAKRNYIKNNPNKRAAHILIGNMLRDGKLFREPCEVCGEVEVHGHHDDYSKPEKVRWLCNKHHNEWHTLNGEALNG